MTTPTYTQELQKMIVLALFAVFILLGVVYGYFVNQTVVHIVERKDIQTDMTILATHISELEFEYINKKNDITLDFALARGFNEIEEPRYVSRDAIRRALTLDTR